MTAISQTLDLGVLGEHEFTMEYDYTPGRPAVLGGPPENCYESEPAEVTIKTITCEGHAIEGALDKLLRAFLDTDIDFYDEVVEQEDCHGC